MRYDLYQNKNPLYLYKKTNPSKLGNLNVPKHWAKKYNGNILYQDIYTMIVNEVNVKTGEETTIIHNRDTMGHLNPLCHYWQPIDVEVHGHLSISSLLGRYPVYHPQVDQITPIHINLRKGIIINVMKENFVELEKQTNKFIAKLDKSNIVGYGNSKQLINFIVNGGRWEECYGVAALNGDSKLKEAIKKEYRKNIIVSHDAIAIFGEITVYELKFQFPQLKFLTVHD